jgi:hypothetical protein
MVALRRICRAAPRQIHFTTESPLCKPLPNKGMTKRTSVCLHVEPGELCYFHSSSFLYTLLMA